MQISTRTGIVQAIGILRFAAAACDRHPRLLLKYNIPKKAACKVCAEIIGLFHMSIRNSYEADKARNPCASAVLAG
jgi:hypothetical protein